jgi:hypothetical protein
MDFGLAACGVAPERPVGAFFLSGDDEAGAV